ncbi:DNA repair exonuclease [Bosea vestrisii]|uniref:metallophosphoesterase family protein n=1 Tax=Bosea vestrisii TaxID=151416 RepID=UPI0024DF67C4|nr:DNA repair exonuclease [Bosea vestrisii]WID95081.1 DNA repair exonuclease [Bosea vestrisii]
MVRFLHSADLHLGKPYGSMPDELRGRLREARHTVLDRLAIKAREGGAATILLAGDVFDTETPSPSVLRQALAAMAGHDGLSWVILPGNHDSLVAEELWATTGRSLPANVLLAMEPAPIQLAQGVIVLPAPCTTRRPGRDLTEWMGAAATPEGSLRIGLAHGAVQSFSEDGGASDVIAPDRAARAGLDYLALGDWHGQMRIGTRIWYSGTPEPDRFKHDAPGRALLVALDAAGAEPTVEPVETGLFDWRMLPLAFLPGDEATERLAPLLPSGTTRRRTLLRVVASGRARPQARAELETAIAAVAPEFALMQLEAQALVTECETDDLDRIDRAGALRQAADALLVESRDTTRSEGEREAARDALMRLFSYCAAMS